MTDKRRSRKDNEFSTSEIIKFDSSYAGEAFQVWVYETHNQHKYVNVEFSGGGIDDIVDAYFYPEDLERLGIMFQYLGKTAREARDGST